MPVALDLRVCPACGDRASCPQPEGTTVRCGSCGHRWSFRKLPLFALTGPSGAGKSTIGPLLAQRLAGDALVLEQDLLWTGALQEETPGHPVFRATWLRMAAMLHQNGFPVVLCGTVAPPELEPLPERAFFSDVHYLALVADDEILRGRLRARPAWRAWDEPRIEEMLEFNHWIRGQVDFIDTTAAPVGDIVAAVEKWVRAKLPV
ncbi:nucleoside kinase [Amycolatopsis sulphurea]|uniref:nucleoside kinase n=1 Tax=Amycolatopsis sulphurea TaxID=76022 RepID=UPI000BF71189|nr:nucleoside kinase [Amycolatopsis sulphurea]